MVRIYPADLTKIFVLETNSGGNGPFDGRLSSVSLNPLDTLTTLNVTRQDIYQPVGLDVDEDDVYVSNDTLNKHLAACNGKIAKAFFGMKTFNSELLS